MHTRRPRPRGGKSAKRQKIRRQFAQGFSDRLGNILSSVDASRTSSDPVPEPLNPPSSSSSGVAAEPKLGASAKHQPAKLSRKVGPSSSVRLVDFPDSAFVEEISSEEEVSVIEEVIKTGGAASDYSSVKRLREVSLGVDQAVFDLPKWVPGSVIVNKIAFRDERGEFSLDSASDLFESLKGCVVLDLYKTVIFPERLSSKDSIRLAKHRGEFQTIERETLSFIFELQRSGFSFCACSFIGRAASSEYLEALVQSELSAVIPVIFVIYNRDQKADLATELGAVAAIDDQKEVVRRYRESGLFAIEVDRNFGIATHKEEIIQQLRDQAGGQLDREVRPKGVPSGLVKDRK